MDQAKQRIRVVSAEIRRGEQYLITQRPAHAVLPLLWEFPGGRVAKGETDEECLIRTVLKRIGVDVVPVQCVLTVTHSYDDYDIDLAVYRCTLTAEPQARSVAQVAWVDADELATYEFPGADQKTVDLLLSDG